MKTEQVVRNRGQRWYRTRWSVVVVSTIKCPLRLGSVLIPTLSWAILRSNTNGTGPVSLTRYPDSSMSPQCWPRLLTTWCVLTLCVIRKRSENWSTIQSCIILTPEWTVHVLRWSPGGSNWNFLQPQVVNGFSTITGIWESIDVEKNVCQRLGDQDSSRRWDLICPSQLMVLKKRIHLGASSSWDSKPAISVLRTDCSTVATMRCRERKLYCSACNWVGLCHFSISPLSPGINHLLVSRKLRNLLHSSENAFPARGGEIWRIEVTKVASRRRGWCRV